MKNKRDRLTPDHRIMRVSQRVSTTFGIGRRTVRSDVIVVETDQRRRTAHVLDQDGVVHGPVAWSRLKKPWMKNDLILGAWVRWKQEDHAAHVITRNIRLLRLWRDAVELDDWNVVDEYLNAPPVGQIPVDHVPRAIDDNEIVGVEQIDNPYAPELGIEEAVPVPVPPVIDVDGMVDRVPQNVHEHDVGVVDRVPHQVVIAEVVPEEIPTPVQPCCICLTDTAVTPGPHCTSTICYECTENYASTLLERPPSSTSANGVPCPCDKCDTNLSWRHVANAVSDVTMNRLVGLYTQAHDMGEFSSSAPPSMRMDDCLEALETIARRRLEESATLTMPCCGVTMTDFDNCFSVKCRACPKYVCAWCLTHTTDDSDESHEHVRNCDENPHPGAVFGDMEYWEDVHRPKKRAKCLDNSQEAIMGAIGDSVRRLVHVCDSLE